jgi:hypothetical protein
MGARSRSRRWSGHIHETNEYAQWSADVGRGLYSTFDDVADLRARGSYKIVTPEQAVDLLRDADSLGIAPLAGGWHPDIGWRCLELVRDRVLPAVARRVARYET